VCVASEIWHKGSDVFSFRSSLVDNEKMRSVGDVFWLASLRNRWLSDTTGLLSVKTLINYPPRFSFQLVEEDDVEENLKNGHDNCTHALALELYLEK